MEESVAALGLFIVFVVISVPTLVAMSYVDYKKRQKKRARK